MTQAAIRTTTTTTKQQQQQQTQSRLEKQKKMRSASSHSLDILDWVFCKRSQRGKLLDCNISDDWILVNKETDGRTHLSSTWAEYLIESGFFGRMRISVRTKYYFYMSEYDLNIIYVKMKRINILWHLKADLRTKDLKLQIFNLAHTGTDLII